MYELLASSYAVISCTAAASATSIVPPTTLTSSALSKLSVPLLFKIAAIFEAASSTLKSIKLISSTSTAAADRASNAWPVTSDGPVTPKISPISDASRYSFSSEP